MVLEECCYQKDQPLQRHYRKTLLMVLIVVLLWGLKLFLICVDLFSKRLGNLVDWTSKTSEVKGKLIPPNKNDASLEELTLQRLKGD